MCSPYAVLLRRVYVRLLGKDQVKPMLVDHWEDFEMMLERKMFGQATGELSPVRSLNACLLAPDTWGWTTAEEGVQKLCAQEAKLPPKVDKWLDRHAECATASRLPKSCPVSRLVLSRDSARWRHQAAERVPLSQENCQRAHYALAEGLRSPGVQECHGHGHGTYPGRFGFISRDILC